jgi:hypothetical protein
VPSLSNFATLGLAHVVGAALLFLLMLPPTSASAQYMQISKPAAFESTDCSSANAALSIANFEAAAAAFEACATSRNSYSDGATYLANAAYLHHLVENHSAELHVVQLLWNTVPQPTSRERHRAHLNLAVRATARDWPRGGLGVDGSAAARALLPASTITQYGDTESKVVLRTILARAALGAGDAKRARTEYQAAVEIARLAESFGTAAWSEMAQQAIAEARMYFAAETGRAALAYSLPPYAGPNTDAATKTYLRSVANRWAAKVFVVIDGAESAYARVLGVELEARPPPRVGFGDPNAPSSDYKLDVDAPISQHIYLPVAVDALSQLGQVWANAYSVLRSLPIPPSWRWTPSGDDGEWATRPAAIFEACAALHARVRAGDGAPCVAWLAHHRKAIWHEDGLFSQQLATTARLTDTAAFMPLARTISPALLRR